METINESIFKIKLNKDNPRLIRDDKFSKLVDSILVLPKMLRIRPIVVDGEGVVLGGNMRLRALRDIGKMTPDGIAQRLTKTKGFGDKDERERAELLSFWESWLTERTVPIVRAEDLTEDEKREFIIKDNVGYGEWDFDILSSGWDMEELTDWGLDFEFGKEEEEEEKDAEEDGYDIDAAAPERCKDGDIWELGSHRLMCGDSTRSEDMERLMGGERATMVFADPPYGMGKEGVENDDLSSDDLLEFNGKWIPLSFGALGDVGSWYCWGNEEPLMEIYWEILRPMTSGGQVVFRNLLTWDKGDSAIGQGSGEMRSYPIGSEKCLFAMKGEQGYSRNVDGYYEGFDSVRLYLKGELERAGLTMDKAGEICGVTVRMVGHWVCRCQWEIITRQHYEKLQRHCGGKAFSRDYRELRSEYEEISRGYEELKREFYESRAYFDNTHENMTDVWHFKRAGHKERDDASWHPTIKPIELCARAVKTSSRPGDIVLDPFGGSGSTLVAAEQLGRRCLMMELTPRYCDVIIDRWQRLTGKEARRISVKGE